MHVHPPTHLAHDACITHLQSIILYAILLISAMSALIRRATKCKSPCQSARQDQAGILCFLGMVTMSASILVMETKEQCEPGDMNLGVVPIGCLVGVMLMPLIVRFIVEQRFIYYTHLFIFNRRLIVYRAKGDLPTCLRHKRSSC